MKNNNSNPQNGGKEQANQAWSDFNAMPLNPMANTTDWQTEQAQQDKDSYEQEQPMNQAEQPQQTVPNTLNGGKSFYNWQRNPEIQGVRRNNFKNPPPPNNRKFTLHPENFRNQPNVQQQNPPNFFPWDGAPEIQPEPIVVPWEENNPNEQPSEKYVPPRIEPGKIFNPRRAKQIFDFSGLVCDGCAPTDTDGNMDVHGKGFITIEAKYVPPVESELIRAGQLTPESRIPYAQKLFLERANNAKQYGGFPSVVFFANHNATNPDDVIDAANAIVLSVYYHGQWHKAYKYRRLADAVHVFWNAVMSGNGNNLDWYFANEF